MATLEFFFDCSSPWTYLAFHEIEGLAAAAGADLVWKPILVGGVFNTINGSVYEQRANPVPAKLRYYGKDLRVMQQTMRDCLYEAMDLEGLTDLLERVEAGEIRFHARDTIEASPMAHEIVSGRPYTYLDNAPLEERRTRAVTLRRG